MAVLRAAALRAAALRALHGVMVQRGTRRLPAKGCVLSLLRKRENTPSFDLRPRTAHGEPPQRPLGADVLSPYARAKRKALRHKPEGFSLYEKDRVKAYRAKVLSAGMKVRAISTMSIAPIIGMIFLAMFMIGTSEIALAMKRFAP